MKFFHLVADHKYDYIETGSLISIKKNTKGITIPSEEERITMFPMDYEEFRWATMNDFASFQLYKTDNRFKPFQVLGQVQDDKLVELLKDIDDSKCVLFCRHTNDPNVGLSASLSDSRFKIYCGDTGLFVTLAFWDKDYTENIIYQKLLNDKLNVNLGYIYENIVAQMLAASGNELFYYTWQKSEADKNHKYEIDFLLSRGFKIHPVEVKSSGYKAHVSLDEFCKKFSHVIDKRYLIYTKDVQKDEATLMIPAYLTSLI